MIVMLPLPGRTRTRATDDLRRPVPRKSLLNLHCLTADMFQSYYMFVEGSFILREVLVVELDVHALDRYRFSASLASDDLSGF